MTDFDRFSDDYDPEPDYEHPTRAEAAAEEELFAEHPHYAARRPIDDEIKELENMPPVQDFWPDFGIGPLCEEDPDREGYCAYHRIEHP